MPQKVAMLAAVFSVMPFLGLCDFPYVMDENAEA